MKRIAGFIIILFILLGSNPSYSQSWRKQKLFEATIGIGTTNFLGELGGANKIGRGFVYDYEVKANRPAVNLGVRYKACQFASLKSNLFYGVLRGSDTYTLEPVRNYRNLSFRSSVVELSVQAEASFMRDKGKNIYKTPWAGSMKGKKKKNNGIWDVYPYVFGGIGVFYFNPKAQYNGKWTALQPLGTEGQGLNGTKKYSRVAIAIPMGVGIKYKLDQELSIGLDVGLRKTFTDYIDDVSTNYYDKSALEAGNGAVSAALSDPSTGVNPSWTTTNEQRGDPNDKDSYMFAVVSLNYRFNTVKQLYTDLFKKRLRPKF